MTASTAGGCEPDDDEPAAGPDERVGVLLSVDPARVDDVLRASVAAGLEDAEPLTAAGVVTGRISPGAVASLRSLPGVEAVEVERTLRGPPPGAPRP